ncbi:unnamed protein product [Owenia fusiformis]|uniref:RNA helicase n=1 Tax=Owenia fusiformis TaxID=6347 RepID=A0A8S4NRN7_OWEFU|nr:unnamed protein product [Owenia fusiformis]
MAASHIAHNIGEQSRTGDVAIQENVEFSGMLLSHAVLLGLKEAGFERPSPIQLKAIPLGRCGLDLIVQAKSGTGKTCVFSVVALEGLQMDSNSVQVLVLAPTREIAVQIWEVMTSLGRHIEGLKCHMFIGGLPVHEDKLKLKNCHIAIGSPGRIKQLIEIGAINTDSVRLFVLDEADKLLESNFQEQINWIYSTLPENKQMLALSATYPESLAQHLTKYSRNPTFVRLNSSDPALLGIKQFFQVTPYHPMQHVVYEEKVKYLLKLLTSATFNQCLVFSNYQTRAENLCDVLNSRGWPATFISGSQEQHLRLEAMAKLKAFQCRVLVSTDLTSRGIDADKVNLVVNMDLPRDHETYLHRIGRAGRFGTYGAAVTYASKGNELEQLQAIERKCNTTMRQLPDPIPNDLVKSLGYIDVSHLVTAEPLNKQTDLAAILNEHLSDTKAADPMTFEIKNKIQENIDESCAYRNGHDIEEATITSVNGNRLSSELSETNTGSVCNGQSKNTIVKPKKDLTFDSRCLGNYIKEFQIPDEDATSKENEVSPNGVARIEDLTTVSFKKAGKKQNGEIEEDAAKCIKATDPESKPGKYRHPYGKWSRIEKPKQEKQLRHDDVNAIENNDSGLDKGLDTGFDGNIGSRTSIQDFGSNITDCINKPEFHLNTQCSVTSEIKAPFLIPPLYKRIKPKPRFATFNDALENYNSFMEGSKDELCDANKKEIDMDSGVDQEKSEGIIGEQLINDVSVYLEKISLEKAHNHQINLIKKHYPNARLIQETNTRRTKANTNTTSERKSDAVQNILSHQNVENKCISEAANSDIHKDNRHRDEEAQTEKAYEEEYEDDYTESESNDSYSDDATDESDSESDDSGTEFDEPGSEFDEDSENDDTSTLGDNATIQGDIYKSAQYINPMVYSPHPYLPYNYSNPWQSCPWQPSYYYSHFAWSPWQHPNLSYPYQYSQLDWDRQIEQTYKAQSDYLKAMSK